MVPRRLVPTTLIALAMIAPAAAAPPDLPSQVPYQGVLLDDTGAPRTGSVDLELRLYDAAAGGTLVYKQEFTSVALSDGVFSIVLGPTGEGTDTPTDPLTMILADALAGDPGITAPDRFLELTVGTESALARTQILSVPYALRAESATTADVATTALESGGIAGLPAGFFGEAFDHFDFDGGAPPNLDPREGLGDADGNGVANFVDPDNDGDGLSDVAELGQGSDINLVTPEIDSLSSSSVFDILTTTVTVTGSNFDASQTVTVGSQTPAPQNLTPTGFDVDLGPQPAGSTTLVVALTNGESDSTPFTFDLAVPTITSLPSTVSATETTRMTVGGTNFFAPITVDVGSESPTPLNLTPTSFEVDVGPQPLGLKPVTVTLINGQVANGFLDFILTLGLTDTDSSFSLSLNGSTNLVVSGVDEYRVDTDGDLAPDATFGFPGFGVSDEFGDIAIAFDPAGALAGIRCRETGPSSCDVEIARDSDADFDLLDEAAVVLESLSQTSGFHSASLTFDSLGGVVAGYMRDANGNAPNLRVAHDRDGDGQFTGTNELVVIDGLLGTANVVRMAVDASDQVVAAYVDLFGLGTTIAYDRSGDGDFDDTVGGNPELFGAFVGGQPDVAVGFAPDGDLFVANRALSPDVVRFARDLNADGDFADPSELVSNLADATGLGGGGRGGFPVSIVAGSVGGLTLYIDRNDDGDFDDSDEVILLSQTNASGAIGVDFDASGRVHAATPASIFVDPTP